MSKVYVKLRWSMSLMMISIGAVSLWTDSVWAQDQIAIYRVQPVQVTHDSVLKLAREAFGMTSPQVTEDSVAFMVQQEQKRLTVWRASGAILFADDSKLWNPNYRISEEDEYRLRRQAEEFLRHHDLFPRNLGNETQLWLSFARFVKNEEGQLVLNHYLIVTGFDTPSQAGNQIPQGWDIIKGVKVEIMLGRQGEVIGLDLRFRDVEPIPASNFPLFTSHQALELLREKLGTSLGTTLPDPSWEPFEGDLKYAISTSPMQAYFQEPPDAEQRYLYPVYIFTLPTWTVEPVHLIPATEFSPLAIIQEPKGEAVFQEGQPIHFRSRVRFGSPPYRYRWLAFGRGELSQASVFRTTLPPGRHLITLEVTDRNGLRNSHTIPIEVQPRPAAVSSPPWALAVAGLVGLGSLGLWSRRRRWLLLGLLLTGIVLTAPHHPTYGGQLRQYGPGWKIQTFFLSKNDGVFFAGLTWKTTQVIQSLSVPWLKVTVKDPSTGMNHEYTLELKNTDTRGIFDQPIPCPNKPNMGQKVGATYTINHTDKNNNIQFSLEVTQSLVLYWPSDCRNFPLSWLLQAPEFYPEVHIKNFKAIQPANLQLLKVRVPVRMDFGVNGPKDDRVALVREPLSDGLSNLKKADGTPWKFEHPKVPLIGEIKSVVITRPLPCPNDLPGFPRFYDVGKAGGGWITCPQRELAKDKFDHYYQGDMLATIHMCVPIMQTAPCAQVHLKHPAWISWQFLAVESKLTPAKEHPDDEDRLEDEQEPATYVTGDALTDPVFWYVADWDVPNSKRGDYRFFSSEEASFTFMQEPFHWSGLTCGFLMC